MNQISLNPYIIPGYWCASIPSPNGDWRATRRVWAKSRDGAERRLREWLRRESWEKWLRRVYG